MRSTSSNLDSTTNLYHQHSGLSSKRVAGLAMNHTVQGIFALETTGLLAWLMILVLWDLCPWVVVAEEDVTQDGRTYRVWAVETQMFQIIVLGDWTTVEGEEEDPTLDFRTLGMWAMEARLFQIIALVDGTMVEGEEEEVKRMGVARVGLVEVVRLLLGTCMIEGGLMGLLSVYRAEMGDVGDMGGRSTRSR